MERFRDVLLEVWREACRHIELERSAGTIGRIVSGHLPIQALRVYRADAQRRTLDAVGFGNWHDAQPSASCHAWSSADWRRWEAWCRRGRVEHCRPEAVVPAAVRPLVPTDAKVELLVGPLGESAERRGALLLAAGAGEHFTARHSRLATALLDPFSAALANDRQLRELTLLREAAEAQTRSLLSKLGRDQAGDTIVGDRSGLKAVMARIDRVVGSDVPVLIFGETGTGKELVARTIHSRSPRSEGPMIRVNCGAIPPELIDSELFGHRRGAFTGASESRRGWFERADGGTLFLDEIAELPPAAQVRLLRVLQDGCLQRVGDEQTVHVDVRIIAATHRDLASMVAQGAFREDLWYRIAVFPIILPPLRERPEDIADLANHFAHRASVRFGLTPVAPGQEDLRLLQDYPWPGNIRELAAVIDRAAILGDGHTLEIAAALGLSPPPQTPASDTPPPPRAAPAAVSPLDQAIRRHIAAALEQTAGRVEGPHGAARLLDVNPHTLRSKMRKLQIDWRQFRAGGKLPLQEDPS
jgi:transcriptional regulator with GAF, ATPase, and Fis domain